MKTRSRAVILAGGGSSRMGRDKATLVDAHGNYLVKRLIGQLSPLFHEVVLVRRSPEDALPFDVGPARILSDLPGRDGPLLGICSGMQGMAAGYCFVTACDMPYLHPRLLVYMHNRLLAEGKMVCVGEYEGYLQPFCAYYHSSLLPAMEKAAGHSSPKKFIQAQDPLIVSEGEIRRITREENPYFNMNTPEEYVAYLSWIKEAGEGNW